jgi:DNA-directed RNA polymerase subunit RPC12/RpoP
MGQALTSNKRLNIKCPECGRRFIYVVPKVKERFEYMIDINHVEAIECPLCLAKLEFGKSYLFGFIRS